VSIRKSDCRINGIEIVPIANTLSLGCHEQELFGYNHLPGSENYIGDAAPGYVCGPFFQQLVGGGTYTVTKVVAP